MNLLLLGSRGTEVENLQNALNYHLPNLLPKLIVDGKFGTNTHDRVVHFQRIHNLKIDGKVGPETHRALYSFVDVSHHLVTEFQNDRGNNSIRKVSSLNESPLPRFPELPRLQLPFPPRLFPLPPVLQAPRLEIDPKLLLLFQKTKFELEAGKETSFKRNLKTGEVEREISIFSELTGTVWSKPIGKLEFSAGGGFVVEKRIKPTPETSASVFIFAKAEVKDLAKLGPLDIAKITVEGRVGGKLGANEPPDMSLSLSIGPEVEILNGRITFGPGAYLKYSTNGQLHIFDAGVNMAATAHF